MALNELDFGGTTLIVKDVKTGYSNPGKTGTQTIAAGSTKTLTAADAGKIVLLDTLTGSVVTLPTSTGSGNTYKFLVSLANTSNSHIIKVGNATDTMVGFAISMSSTTGIGTDAATGTDDTLTMNGTTTGGQLGTYVECTDFVSGKYSVRAFCAASGTAAAPTFTATV